MRETDADYYTDAIDYSKVKPLDEFDAAATPTSRAAYGEVHVLRRVAGYKKIRYYTHENVGYGQVRLPDHEMHTTAVWWELSPHALAREFATRHEALEGFLGAANAVHRIAALVSLAEPHDLGKAVGDGGPESGWAATAGPDGRAQACTLEGNAFDLDADGRAFRPTLYLYDNFPGGIGLAAPLYDLRDRVIERAIDLVAHCPCSHGCPACVGPVLATDPRARHSPKSAALRVLALVQGAQTPLAELRN